jgi:hypothetical protein
MLSTIKNIFLEATSFLQTGKVPPGAPERLRERLEDINHLSSKKFFIVLSSIVILAIFYYSSVAVLFIIPTIPPEIITAYTTIFTKTAEILAIVVGAYMGCQSIVDLKYNSNSQVNLESSTQTIKEEIKEEIITNQKEDDYELH